LTRLRYQKKGKVNLPKLKPWYKVVTPREDLREGKPLDASEFAVHLDQVRDGRASEDYQNPVRFFERTFLTKSLRQEDWDWMTTSRQNRYEQLARDAKSTFRL